MEKEILKVLSNRPIAKDVYEMVLEGSTKSIAAPGQFINLAIEGLYLRRPISVCDYDENTITIIYKVVGKGTEIMSRAQAGAEFDVLVGLGNGFDVTLGGSKPAVIGGGVGVPPLYHLAKRLIAQGSSVTAVLGFNRKEEVFYAEEFAQIGCKVLVTTADGSVGIKGFVTDAMDFNYTYVYTCGPEAMLKAVYDKSRTSGQFSFERRMGCGFGACMGCTCKTKYGNKRICREGPVLVKEEIIW